MKKILHTIMLCCFVLLADTPLIFAQQRMVKGIVKDEKGAPVQGASVMIKGANTGTSTNSEGAYSIAVSGENLILIIRSISFAPQEIPVNSSLINVTLKEESSTLNQVVVMGYGTTQKAVTVTGSVSTIAGKELVATSVSNVSNMLIGNAPGISGLQQSGEPGRNGTRVYIRGVSTYTGNTDPLVVIDGVPEAPEQTYTRLNAMDANEIESINVLKDASATAIYGVRGANGVLIVTTKRGRAGTPVLNVSTNFGATRVAALPKNLNSYDYAVMRNEAIKTEQSSFGNASYNDFIFSQDDLWKFQNNRDYTPAEIAAYPGLTTEQRTQLAASPALYYASHDLFKEQFGGIGPQQQFNLNIRGGTEKVRYYTSLGYFAQGSILENTDYYEAKTESKFDRYNFLSNFDISVVKNLDISVNLSGQFGTATGPGIGVGTNLNDRYAMIIKYLYETNSMTAPGIINNNLINGIQGDRGSASNPLGIKIGSINGAQNAIRNLLVSGRESIYDSRLDGRLALKHTMNYVTKGLSARATVNYLNNYGKALAYSVTLPEYTVRRNPANPNQLDFFGGGRNTSGNFIDPGHNSVNRTFYVDGGLDYSRTFGSHSVTGLLLGNAQKYYLPGDEFNTASGTMGLAARTTYDFKERYLAEVTVAYNGTEQFIVGNRFGLFPAFSAGWVLSKEPFFPENRILTFFKVRGSYGKVGYDRIGGDRYVYLPSSFATGQAGYRWGSSDGSINNPEISGVAESKLGNPDVTWEEEVKQNLAIETKFLNNKLSFTADFFKSERTNIFTRPGLIPASYGVNTSNVAAVNLGIVRNHGYEMQLGWNQSTSTVTYYVNGQVSYAKNKIIYNAEALNDYTWMNATGYSIDQYKGYVFDGYYNTVEEVNNRPNITLNGNKATVGDIRWKDINGDGLIDPKDRVPIGNTNRALYDFSLKSGVSYKNFDFSILFIGKSKGSFNLNNRVLNYPFIKNAGNAFQWQYDGRWTPEKFAKGENITYPRASISGSASEGNNFVNGDFWLVSNAFKKLKNVELGYSFRNSPFLQKAHINSIRVYANGNNLYTWDHAFKGIDPEQADSGSGYLFPLSRTLIFGANIQF